MYAPLPPNIEMTNINHNQPYQNNYYSVGGYNPNTTLNPQQQFQPQNFNPNMHQAPKDAYGINGPLEMRECTDVFWGILFLTCFFAFFGMVGFGIHLGKPSQLLGFYNQDGVLCSSSQMPC